MDADFHQRENSAGVWVAVSDTPGRNVFRVSNRGLLHKGAMVARNSKSSPLPVGAGEGAARRCRSICRVNIWPYTWCTL